MPGPPHLRAKPRLISARGRRHILDGP
jgi:hypothetical protein